MARAGVIRHHVMVCRSQPRCRPPSQSDCVLLPVIPWRARRSRDQRPSSPRPAPASRPRRPAPAAPGRTPARRLGPGRRPRPSASAAGCVAPAPSAPRSPCGAAGTSCRRPPPAPVILLAQRLADRADGGFRHRPQRRRVLAALHRRIGRLRSPRVRCGGIDRAVGVQHQPARRARLLHRAARDAGVRRVSALVSCQRDSGRWVFGARSSLLAANLEQTAHSEESRAATAD